VSGLLHFIGPLASECFLLRNRCGYLQVSISVSFQMVHVLLFHLPICVHVSQFWGLVDFAETTEPKTEMEKGIETWKEMTSCKGYMHI